MVETFFTEVMSLADRQGLLSREHFSVDGTLIQAWASHKSFRPKDGPHESGTDPDARLFKKSSGSPAILCYHGHVLMENRSGLMVGAVVSMPMVSPNARVRCVCSIAFLGIMPERSEPTKRMTRVTSFATAGYAK